MRSLVSTLLALLCVLTLTAGAHGQPKRIPWLTFNEASLDGKHRVLSRHDIFPATSSLSPTHDRFAYVDYTCDGCPRSNRLMVADVRGPGGRMLVDATYGISEVTWAPNGKTIAFVSDGLWLIDPDGTNLRRVADPAAMLAWSPDSKRLAFARLNSRLGWEISILSLDSGQERALTNGQRPRWSPHRKLLLFESVTGRNEAPKIRVVSANGGSGRTVARGSFPSWSPDGTRIAFVRYDDYTGSVWIAPSRGGRPRRVAKSRSGAETALWSPDSRRLALNRGGYYCGSTLVLAGVDGGRPRPIASETRILTPVAWTNGGRKVLYTGERCSDQ